MADLQPIEISKKIKEYFKEKGITQDVLAATLGVSQAAVWAQLNGKPFGKKQAKKWEDAFGIKSTWLLTGEGQMIKNLQNVSESDQISIISEEQTEYNTHFEYSAIEAQDKMIENLLKMIDRLNRENDRLSEENLSLKKTTDAREATA